MNIEIRIDEQKLSRRATSFMTFARALNPWLARAWKPDAEGLTTIVLYSDNPDNPDALRIRVAGRIFKPSEVLIEESWRYAEADQVERTIDRLAYEFLVWTNLLA